MERPTEKNFVRSRRLGVKAIEWNVYVDRLNNYIDYILESNTKTSEEHLAEFDNSWKKENGEFAKASTEGIYMKKDVIHLLKTFAKKENTTQKQPEESPEFCQCEDNLSIHKQSKVIHTKCGKEVNTIRNTKGEKHV